MKKFYLMALCAAAFAFTGCEEKEQIPAPEQEFLSYFGFEAKEGVFAEDVKVENPQASGVISFLTPVGTDSEAYKALVPVFETTNPDAVVTDADGKVLVSGEPFDFSKEVDIYVTVSNKGGETSTMYTIKVEAKAALAWSKVAETEELAGAAPSMAINPVDGCPYFVAKQDGDGYGIAYKYDGTLQPVAGTSPVFHAYKIDKVGLGFDNSGEVYAAFRDYAESAKAAEALVSVMKIGSTSSYVGNKWFTAYPNDICAIFPQTSSNIWVAYQLGTAVGSLSKRYLELAQWNGSAWSTEMAMTGRAGTDYAYYTKSVHANGVDYLFVYNQNSHSVSLYQLGDNGWTTVVEALKFNKADGTAGTESMLNLRSLDCDVASNGDVYFMVGCQFISETYNVAVVRYRPSDKSQTIVGGVTDKDIDDDRYFSMALDAYDIPYLAYRSAADELMYVQYIDNKTKTWSQPVCISADKVNSASPVIRFNEDGKGYIAVRVESKKIQVYSAK